MEPPVKMNQSEKKLLKVEAIAECSDESGSGDEKTNRIFTSRKPRDSKREVA